MELHEVQSHVAACIAQSPELAAFGAALVYSIFDDVNTSKTRIAERLRTTGVCIEITSVEADASDDKIVRGQAADAAFDVLVAESPSVAHSPREDLLRKSIITAVCRQVDAYTPRARFVRSDRATSEQGYVLQILSFTLRVIVP